MTYRLTSEWLGLKRQQPFPPIDSLNPKTCSVDWKTCVLIRQLDHQASPFDENLEFEFVGSSFRKDAPKLASGSRVCAIPDDSLLSLSLPILPRIFERRTAVIYGGTRPWKGNGSIVFHAIGVPFGDSSGALKYALVAVSHSVSKTVKDAADPVTELLEYCDGDWSPLEEEAGGDLTQAA